MLPHSCATNRRVLVYWFQLWVSGAVAITPLLHFEFRILHFAFRILHSMMWSGLSEGLSKYMA